jgi:hypothetical protein
VKATPGTLQEGGASFATTHWSVVAQAALTDVPEAADALAKLCETYWPPIELRWAKSLTSGALDSLRQELQTFFFLLLMKKNCEPERPLVE